MQDRHLQALATKREETVRAMHDAELIPDRLGREKAMRKLTATQTKIDDLETRYLQLDNLPQLHPDKTDIQIKRMRNDVKAQIRRLTDEKAKEAYNKRAREHMKRARNQDEVDVDPSKKQGTEEYRLAKIAEWEKKLEAATTPGQKQMAKKRINFFKKSEEERAAIKKKNAERSKKSANKKKDRALLAELDHDTQAEPAPAPTVKRIKIKIAPAATPAPADEPVIAVIPDIMTQEQAVNLDDMDLGFDLDAAIENALFGESGHNLWNSRMQNTNETPAQHPASSMEKQKPL